MAAEAIILHTYGVHVNPIKTVGMHSPAPFSTSKPRVHGHEFRAIPGLKLKRTPYLGVLGNNLYSLLIIILKNSKNYDFSYGSKFPNEYYCALSCKAAQLIHFWSRAI